MCSRLPTQVLKPVKDKDAPSKFIATVKMINNAQGEQAMDKKTTDDTRGDTFATVVKLLVEGLSLCSPEKQTAQVLQAFIVLRGSGSTSKSGSCS